MSVSADVAAIHAGLSFKPWWMGQKEAQDAGLLALARLDDAFTLEGSLRRDVADEIERQNAKWGEQQHVDAIWLAILTEEVGETAQGVLHETFGGSATIRDELVQVAAVALQWLEALDRAESQAAA